MYQVGRQNVCGLRSHPCLCRPDNRSWRPFSALSGGQQALATLALSFALHAAYPSPLCFFDEIDCALDSSTAARVADYIRSLTQSQYIVVSHKPQAWYLCGTLLKHFLIMSPAKKFTGLGSFKCICLAVLKSKVLKSQHSMCAGV